jgi:Fe2+ transport system protein FeoA
VENLIPLSLLAAGQVAQVDQLLGSPHEVHRLSEMGFTPGASLEMIQPGSPCIVRLSGSKLCLRDANLFQILVHPASTQSHSFAMRKGA